MEFKERIYKAALEYVGRGWLVFPIHTVDDEGRCSCGNENCGDAGKHPRVQRGLKEASRDLAKIEEWFGPAAPPANIGLVTGEISGITVIDIDIGDGKFGAESWAEAIKDHGEPQTLMAQTGSGGMHVVFQYNSALKTASNVLGKGVDCRNDGGYIVAAPSRHRSGGVYSWLNWGDPIGVLPAHLSRRKESRGRPKNDDTYRGKYTIEQVTSMLEPVPADDRDLWRSVGIILGREFNRVDEAWALYVQWSNKFGGKKGRNHDEIMHEAFYELSQQESGSRLTIGTIVKAALDNGWAPKSGEVPLGNFVYYGPGNNFIYRPTISYWVAGAVDAAVSPINDNGKIVKASEWLKLNQLVTSMTCDPAIDEDYVRGHDCRNGEIVVVPGAALFNTYRKPTIELGVPKMAQPFLDHVHRIFNKQGDAQQFLNYMAHRVQKPWEKPRFALLIAGGQGVGKDTAVEFCCPAIGVWNVANIDPAAFESSFNEFASSTLVRISEAANLHEMSKWAFNERTKVLIAGSPDVCAINPKYGQKYSVRMYCGVIITTNHLASGIYIPPDDRRYDVIEAATMDEMGLRDENKRREYFSDLWDWFIAGGASHVAAYLHEHDLSGFSASNGQRKTDAHKTVVAGGMSGDSWLDDILDELGNPIGVRGDWIVTRAVAMGEKDADVKRKLSNAIGRVGYTMFKNPLIKDGRWKIDGKKVTVYVKCGTSSSYNPLVELDKEPF
jgi:Bifunctional DNA primase/polymerase, N-terminal/Family of unknown function (DUF5906)